MFSFFQKLDCMKMISNQVLVVNGDCAVLFHGSFSSTSSY